jgi:tetratricopeptide (TPR) repeat protein
VTKITLSNNGGIRMPVPVCVVFEDGSQQTKRADRELDFPVLTFTAKSPVKEVTLNPGNAYAMIGKPPRKKPGRSELRTLAEYRRALKDKPLVKKIRLAMGNYTPEDCKKVAAYFELALQLDVVDVGAWHLLGIALYDGERYQEAVKAFERMARYARGEKGAAYVWMGQLYDLLGERKKAVVYYNKALLAGVPHYQYGQYKIMMTPAYVEQLLKNPFVRRVRGR